MPIPLLYFDCDVKDRFCSVRKSPIFKIKIEMKLASVLKLFNVGIVDIKPV